MRMLEIPKGSAAPYERPPEAAEGAVLRIAGQGRTADFASGEDGVARVLTGDLPVGEYKAFWSWTDADGVDFLVRTDGFDVKPLEGLEWDEKVLAAAREVLLTASTTDRVSLSVEGTSFSFESRTDLLTFINLMERRVRHGRRRAELGVTKRGKVYIRRSGLARGVWG